MVACSTPPPARSCILYKKIKTKIRHKKEDRFLPTFYDVFDVSRERRKNEFFGVSFSLNKQYNQDTR